MNIFMIFRVKMNEKNYSRKYFSICSTHFTIFRINHLILIIFSRQMLPFANIVIGIKIGQIALC